MESDLHFMDCEELGEIIGKKICDAVVVDVRPLSDFVVGHIPGAFSVRLSSILIRRLAQNKISFVDILMDEQKERFRKWISCNQKKVVVYDDSSSQTDVMSGDGKNALVNVARSLGRDFGNVSVLQGELEGMRFKKKEFREIEGKEHMQGAAEVVF